METKTVQLTELQLALLSGSLHEKLEELDERLETGYISQENYDRDYAETNAMIDVIDGAMYA